MADVVASQTLLDGERLFIGKFTNISDGTGETAVVKINPSTLSVNAYGRACNGVKINKIWATTHGMEVRILWDATTDVFAWMIPQNTNYFMDFSSFGGLQNNAGTGVNGNVLFTTADASSGDMYTIVIEGIKTYASA
jgi:hypothetical protein